MAQSLLGKLGRRADAFRPEFRGAGAAFRQHLAAEEPAGKTLDFIAQEMHREINTIGSKANDATIQVLVVQMKEDLERIKEQVLNIV